MKKVLLLGIFVLLSVSLIFAAQPLPHAFEGQIFSKDGSLTSGKTLIATLDGTVTGKATIDGNNFKITVLDNTASGGEIKFFMGEEEADLSFSFKAFEVTKTNLTFDTIPDETIGDCGDGICAVEECAFCAIDCPVFKCNNNNVCDASIGEDCITAPADCGECVSCGDAVCNGDETCSTCSTDCGTCEVASSGGGGGGGGGASTPIALISNLTDENPVSGLSIEGLNEEIDKEVIEIETKRSFFNFLTGWAIGDGEENSSPWIKWLVLVAILLVAFGAFKIIRNRNSKR